MNRVHLLPDELINQIAAGEVVERPASVVKELVENSLDAGARNIQVEIGDGGRKLIRVVDNGSGMSREDAQLAFSRHATSKISSLTDLHKISTLGFRGEALPSIAAVSRIEMVTRTEPDEIGTQIRIESGELLSVKDSPANQGTKFTVSDLFYSTPVRRKFLKSQLTETRHIIDLVSNFAFSFPEVSFNLGIDSRELIKVKSTETLPQRISSLLGVDAFKKLIQIPPEDSSIKITGYIARPELSKSSRTDIRFFVNKRSINNRSLLHALTSAYGDMLTKGRFPLAIIFLEVLAELVDVNVHPQKLEVRFQDERGAHDLLYRAVKKALDREFTAVVRQTMSATSAYEIPHSSGLPLKEKTSQYHTSFEVNPSALTEILAASKSVSEQSRAEPTAQANFYQIFNTYIVTQSHDQLLIVDQHAAHERVLYEQILGSLQTDTFSSSQKLLFPETAELDPTQLSLLQSNLKPLEKLGFEIQPLGGRTILISALPAIAKQGSVQFLKEVLQEFEEQQKKGKDQRTALASALACKAAIKSGDSLTIPEMQSLLKNLLPLDTPQVCPHGRPTLIRIPIAELERRFGRS